MNLLITMALLLGFSAVCYFLLSVRLLTGKREIGSVPLGAAFLAGLATGVWKSESEITDAWREERRFEATEDRQAVDQHLSRWREAVAKA